MTETLRPFAHCPLPTAHCPLPTAHCPPTSALSSAPCPLSPVPCPLSPVPLKSRLLKAAAAALLLLILLWLCRAPILRTAAHLWIMDEAPVPARAIVVLGGGEDYRPFAAARLWKQGLAPVILVPKVEASPTESLGLRPTTTQVILGVLKAQGIPDSAIQLYGQDVSSTREEALAVQTWLQSNAVDEAPAEFPPNPQVPPPAPPPDSPSGTKPQEPKTENREPGTKNVPPAVILIPTDPFATRRTNAFFEKTLPGYDVRVLRIDPPDLKVDSWWTQEKGLITFQNEVIKWLFYKVKY